MLPSIVPLFRRRVLVGASALLLTVGLGVFLQRSIVEASGRAARDAGLASPVSDAEPRAIEPEDAALPSEPLVVGEDFDDPVFGKGETGKKPAKRKTATIVVPGSVTESWVRRGIIPEVVYARPGEGLPGGLVTSAAASFVAGLGPSDRLTHVDGVEVRSLEGVVSLVARAVREKRNAVRATFCRKEGTRTGCVHLAIELPREATGAELDPE